MPNDDRQLRARKFYVRPLDVASEARAIGECAAYSQLREQYRRLRHNGVVPFGPLTVEAYARAQVLRKEAAQDGRRKQSAENSTERGLLRLEASRRIYAHRRCCYTTARLAQQAGEKAEHALDPWQWLEGRAGMLPERMQWQDRQLDYCGTSWLIQRRQWLTKPVAPDQVRQAWLQRERWSPTCRTRPRWRWYLVMIISEELTLRDVRSRRCAAGLDLAWRHDADAPALRVAYVADDWGRHEAITMPARAYARMEHADGVQSIADRVIADPLRAELGMHPRSSYGRVIHAAAAGEKAPRAEQLLHLAEWSEGQKRHAIASRNQHYVLEIQRLCRSYHTIYIENIKGVPALVARAKTRRKKAIEKNDVEATEGAKKRDQRQRTAPFVGFLRRLQHDAPKYGTAVIEVEKANTSRKCANTSTSLPCGHYMGDPGPARERRCAVCGRSWDVDHLAACNLLLRGTARVPGQEAAE